MARAIHDISLPVMGMGMVDNRPSGQGIGVTSGVVQGIEVLAGTAVAL